MVNNDLADEMVEPAQDHNAEQEQASDGGDNDDKQFVKTCSSTDISLTNIQQEVKQEDDRVSSTSLYCSLPLSQDVQSIIDTFPKSTDPERKKTRKLPCLYCERTFVADGLRQKHVERCHSVKQARRSSSRFQQGAVTTGGGTGPTTLQCQFCDAFQPTTAGEDDLGDLFRHLVGEHADRYFACVLCRERFVLRTHLDEHREEEHGIKKEALEVDISMLEETGIKGKGVNHKGKAKDLKETENGDPNESKDTYVPRALKYEKIIMEQKELRSKKTPIKSTKLGTKRSARLQNKETPQTTKHSSASSTTSSSSSTSSKKKGKVKETASELPEREIQKVATHENPYPTFDAFYRVKKITDHSIDNLRITSLTFNDVFDQAFYTRIKCNIADNLQNHIDGKLFKNEESESRISNFEKTPTEIKPDENNYGCEISLHAATPVATFLAPQLGDDPETQIEYGSKASKKKTKPDEVHYKYFTRRKYQASIQEIKENRDLSKLDMWTQYVVKNRQQAIANTARTEKEKQDYKKGDEYRAKVRYEELNRILDRRGPFEDLKLEANKQAVLDGNISREARVEASCLLEDVLQRVFDLTQPEVFVTSVKTELTDAEIPSYLNLRRASLTVDAHVDRSDKITLICSSEETENFEAPQVSPRDKHALVELSGEWTRSRLFICAACGTRLANMRALIDHKNIMHQNVWCQHYEFVGNQGAYYKHLSIPGLGKMDFVEESPVVKSWVRSAARQCTKCKKVCNALAELHRHILECGQDWSWMLVRKKCKYRPFGSKTRRKRRGLLKRHEPPKKENKEKKTYKRTEQRPREKPSDAETIRRMLANLPAKRATRTEMSLKDGFPRPNKKIDPKNMKNKNSPKSRTENRHQENSSGIKRHQVLVPSKCNPVNNVRKSVRNLNKVISSSLIDNNIMMRRKFKALHAQQRAPRARAVVPLEAPVELTEEQCAENVKKEISLFKKVQKFRRSLIKKRTTKVSSSSSAESNEKLWPEAGTSAKVQNASETWRKTRSANNHTDNSSGTSDRQVKPPIKKKLRANFGAKLLRTFSMRRKSRADTDSTSSTSTSAANPPEEKRKRFAGIKKAVKKLKVTNQNKKSDKSATKVSESEESPIVPSNEHFLEESIRENVMRTISDSQEIDNRDNDNRPSAIAPPLSTLSDNNVQIDTDIDKKKNILVHTIQQQTLDSDNVTLSAPIITVTLADKDIDDEDNKSKAETLSPGVPLLKTVKTLNETLSVSTVLDSTNSHLSVDGITLSSGQLTSPPILPSLSPLLGRSKNKLCKRAKGLNDCIAMLTSKLQCKDDTSTTTLMHSPISSIKEAVPLLIPQQHQQPETPVVIVTPHDTLTEEQNVVIPEETVSENLESAKEPEVAPPSPLPTKITLPEAATEASIQTSITISNMSSPVIEQDKENIEMEQKSIIPAMGYDVTLEKVVDLIKCFEDIHPKGIRNGHLDQAKTDVINGLKTQTARKIGSNRKAPNKRVVERTFVQEQLNIARLEEDLILNDFERKIGSRRSLPQRKTKTTFVDLKIPEIKLKDRLLHKSVLKKNLSTIMEETQLFDKLVCESETRTTDKSQAMSEAPQAPLLVHTVQQNQLSSDISAEKDELPVDLSLTRKSEIPVEDNVPVDLSTKKTTHLLDVSQVSVLSSRNLDIPLDIAEKTNSCETSSDPSINTPVNLNLEINPQAPVENEAIILETKAIPQRSLAQVETSSESEDELPLAALKLKTIGSPVSGEIKSTNATEPCNKLEDIGNKIQPIEIIPSEKVKSQIKEAFSKKVKKHNNGLLQTKSNRKRKSDVASLHTYLNPMAESNITIDKDCAQDIAKDIEVQNVQDDFTNDIKNVKSSSAQNILQEPIHPISPAESPVCTLDVGLPENRNSPKHSLQNQFNSSIQNIDYQDILPVVSISPSEAVKSKRNRTTAKSIEEVDVINNGKCITNNIISIPMPKAKRGRKPKLTSPQKPVSVLQLTDDFQCKAKRLDFGMNKSQTPDALGTTITSSVVASEIEPSGMENVMPSGEVILLGNNKLIPNTLSATDTATNTAPAKDVEIISTQTVPKKIGKSITLKARKVGRPKSKRGRIAAKDKNTLAKEEPFLVSSNDVTRKDDVDESNNLITKELCSEHDSAVDYVEPTIVAAETIGPNEQEKILADSLTSTTSAALRQSADVVDAISNGGLTQKDKETHVAMPSQVTTSIGAEVEVPESEDSVLNSVRSNQEDLVGKTVESPLETTPQKPKSKRGRKPKAKVLPVPEFLPEVEQEISSNILSETHTVTTEPAATRLRKRKSDELNSSSTPIDNSNEMSLANIFQVSTENEAKKSIAIYDFDEEDDECTGDNSKENMDQLKTKAMKRTKRSGHSPNKVHITDDVHVKLTPPKSLVKELQENILEIESTPLKDVQNESFIQTPDLNDSGLATKIATRFRVKKGKNSKAKKIPIETQEHLCQICNKQFGRLDSLNKHKRTLTHIAKLSEIEALEAEAKKKLEELNEFEPEKAKVPATIETPELNSKFIPDKDLIDELPDQTSEKLVSAVVNIATEDKVTVNDFMENLDAANILSPTSEFMRGRSHSDVTKSMLVTSPFSLKTNNDSLRLADIISDVLNKPVENMDNYTDVDKQSHHEPKRYKSLGERKSFDSDSAYTPASTFNISPASTLINKNTSDEFLKNQLSLLENIIEENKASFEYMDDTSDQSLGSDKSDRCPSDMSLVSVVKANDSSRIISYNDERDFVKPNAQYEEISEDSVNNRNYEQERSRKTLNRDEELFLECCSLLKSSSEVSESKKSRAMPVSDYNTRNRSNETNVHSKQSEKVGRKLVITDDDFMSDSCPNTPIGDTYDDFSNSDTIKTDWSTKLNEKESEDISRSSLGPIPRTENSFKAFNFKLDSKSDIDESSNSVDFRKNINAKFVGLMAEAMKVKSPKRRKQKERRKSDTTQTSITDYAVQLTPKSTSNSTDNFTDLTNDSKKVMTKGAMKIFEGLKVSIPTDEIDMNQVLDCSPRSKRLELEESAKILGKTKGLNFGNKLGMKVTKKRNARNRKQAEFLNDPDKIYDVYDFEETQDNTYLFSPISKINFKNGMDVSDKHIVLEKNQIKPKRAKLKDPVIESESESINQDLDFFSAEVQSVNSFSTETESSTSVKQASSVTATQENITKKKCQIMGRIFKNAFKAKIDGIKENSPIDDGDDLENYIIGGPEIATPPSEKDPPLQERPKMSEQEMDLLFDKLLHGNDAQQPLKVNTKTNSCLPIVLPINKIDASNKSKTSIDIDISDVKESKENKTKKVTPKSVKNNRRRSRKQSESSDDEFNLAKTPKKRQIRKTKPRDNGINLDEEMKECMGVAGRKSQRKCTSGKQNVLIEYWSSDDSEFEAMLRLSMQESGTNETAKEASQTKAKPAQVTQPQSVATEGSNIDTEKMQSNNVESSEEIYKVTRNATEDDSLDTGPALEPPTTNSSTALKNKVRRSNGAAKSKNERRENKSARTPKAKHPRAPRTAQEEATLAANRRKRTAADTLYYWSSSSEDDTQNLIEVKPIRDEIDDEEDRPQHGWIVGDSPKKLVTLLAHAKGKKTNR